MSKSFSPFHKFRSIFILFICNFEEEKNVKKWRLIQVRYCILFRIPPKTFDGLKLTIFFIFHLCSITPAVEKKDVEVDVWGASKVREANDKNGGTKAEVSEERQRELLAIQEQRRESARRSNAKRKRSRRHRGGFAFKKPDKTHETEEN